MARKPGTVLICRNLEQTRADDVDPAVSRHVDRRRLDETGQRPVCNRGSRPHQNRIAVQNTTGQREGATFPHRLQTGQDQTDLRECLVFETEPVFLDTHVLKAREFNLSGCRDDRVDRTGCPVHRLDTFN